ncbi:MAG TPA: hypothetical protein VGP61_04000 [Gemmatimonadales bacterium]|jgi:hypothetical protein|nr:hypothetical protein [Gemmatimonadales bacterium]
MTRRLRCFSILLTTLAGACGGGLAPLPIPTGLAPATLDVAARWADSTRPVEQRDIRFRWKFQDEHSSAGGRGRARLNPPDSLRFDVAGPLGSGHAAAFVAGDTALWAEPEEDVRKLVPNYPLFWAMLGIARSPVPGSVVRRFSDAAITAWQFAHGQDTVEYVRENGAAPRLLAEVRQGGKRLGRVETKLSPDGLAVSSRLTVVHPASRLDLTFYQNVKARPFAPDTWTRPAPPAR